MSLHEKGLIVYPLFGYTITQTQKRKAQKEGRMTTEEMIEALGEDAFPVVLTMTIHKDGGIEYSTTRGDGSPYVEPDALHHLLMYRSLKVGALKQWAREVEEDTHEFLKELREALSRSDTED
jgi:hypothetical protein